MDAARKALAGAEAEAKKNNWPVAIAIVDSSGKLAAFSNMDNTQHASVDIAMDHATGCMILHDPGHSLEERILREQFGA